MEERRRHMQGHTHRNFSNPVLSADSEEQLPFEPVPKLRFRGNEVGNISGVRECLILKIQMKVRFQTS